MLSIFISYAREDAAFVEWLATRLTAANWEPWVDRRNIPGGAFWREEIHKAIEAADIFVVVVTQAAMRSEYCLEEISYAAHHGKRLISVRRHEVDQKMLPAELKPIQWVDCFEGQDPQQAFDGLIEALESDLPWEQHHTKLLARALEWARGNHDDSFLLRGVELQAALGWQADASEKPRRKSSATIRPFVDASQAWQTREFARIQALYARALGRELAAQAEIVRQQSPDFLERSVLLAAEAMIRSPSLEADQALRTGLLLLPRALARQRHRRPVEVVRFSGDGSYFAAGGRDGIAHVSRTSHGENGTMLTHGAEVRDLAFSPDGRLLVTAGGDGVAVVWELPGGKPRARLPAGKSLSRVCFSDTGSALATANWEGIAIVWEIHSGRETSRVLHDAAVLHLAFAPSGTILATASQDGSARVWEVSSGRELFRVEASSQASKATRTMRRVAFSPDGERLAVACADGTAMLCDAQTGSVLFRLAHSSAVHSLAYSQDGRWLATGEGYGAALWDARTGRLNRRLPQTSLIWDVAFDDNGKVLATGGHDGTARLWDCHSGQELVRAVHAHAVYSVAVSPDGRLLATASADHAYDQWLDNGGEPLPFHGQGNAACLWEARGGAIASSTDYVSQVHALDRAPNDGRFAVGTGDGVVHFRSLASGADEVWVREEGRVRCLQFSADGERLAVGGEAGIGRILDARTGREVARLEGIGPTAIEVLGWAADGSRLAAGLRDGSARIWDAATGSELSRMVHTDSRVTAILFHPDHARLISAGGDGIRVWDAVSGKESFRLAADVVILDLALSPDGGTLATGNEDSCAFLCDLKTERIRRLVHGGRVCAVSFSPNGGVLATGADDHCARLWDTTSGKESARLHHESDVRTVSFSPDGQHLGTGSWDQTSRVWTVESGREVARMPHPGFVSRVAFTLDGRHLATAAAHTVRFWLWQPEALLSDASSRVTRNLTPDEWRQYLPGEPYRQTFLGLVQPGGMTPRVDRDEPGQEQ